MDVMFFVIMFFVLDRFRGCLFVWTVPKRPIVEGGGKPTGTSEHRLFSSFHGSISAISGNNNSKHRNLV